MTLTNTKLANDIAKLWQMARPFRLLSEKNRLVQINKGSKTCYGQVEDAGPARYNDATCVSGTLDARPQNHLCNAAGLDVSPAPRNGCLGSHGWTATTTLCRGGLSRSALCRLNLGHGS